MSHAQKLGLACLVFLVLGVLLGRWIDSQPTAGPRPWWYRAVMSVVGLALLLIALDLLT